MPGLFGNTPGPGGLFGRAPQAPQAKDSRNFLDKLLGVYAGDADSQKKERNAGLVQAGLAMLQASGPSPVRPQLGQILGAGLAAGMGGAQAQHAKGIQEATKAKYAELAGQGPAALTAMYQQAIANGDLESAKSLAEIIKSQGANLGKPIVVSPGAAVWDPAQGKMVYVNPNQAGGASQKPGKVYDPASKKEVYATWDPVKREYVPIEGSFVPKPGSAGNPSELERRANMFVPLANAAEAQIRAFEQSFGAPERMMQITDWAKLNELMPEQGQLLYTAGKQLGDAYLRMTSGAAIKEEEVDMFIRSFLPYPGDRPSTIAFKRNQRENFITGLQVIGRRAAQEGTEGYVSVDEAMSDDYIDDVIEQGRQAREAGLPPIDVAGEQALGEVDF